MDNGDGLGESEVALYRAVLAHPRATLGQAAAELGRTDGEVDKAWAKLLEMGLLRMDGDEALIAVNPMLAEAMVLGAEELELSARRASVEGRRDAIRQLVPDWNTALTPAVLTSAVEVISDQAATGNVLMHYAESCRVRTALGRSRPAAPDAGRSPNPGSQSVLIAARDQHPRAVPARCAA